MNENVQKSLVMGASIMVTIGIISIGLMIFSQGSSLVKESSKNIVSLTQELSAKRYIAYDNAVVSGSEVINAINTYATEQMRIDVKTHASKEEKSYNTKYSNYDTNDENYINSNGMFESMLLTNDNGVIEAIKFNQI